MTWKGNHPIIELLDNVYENGICLTKKVFQEFEDRLLRDKLLPKHFVKIQSQSTYGW